MCVFAVLNGCVRAVRAPNWYVDQVYGSVPGAVRVVDEGDVLYTMPCDTKMNVSFIFGCAPSLFFTGARRLLTTVHAAASSTPSAPRTSTASSSSTTASFFA